MRPRDARDVAEILRLDARAVEVLGAGSKRSIGARVDAAPLELAALSGIVDYEPAELVLTARAATPLSAVDAVLAERGQRLAFEPPDFGPLLGVPAPQTLGGVLAANLAGSRRLTAGAARDHFLGFAAVTGDGTPFKAGGRVVKNVTGYDLPKLLAGSWGTLAVLTEVTVRVAPRPETETTLIVPAGSAAEALAQFGQALDSPGEISAAAYEPRRGAALRLEGFAASVTARADGLLERLGRPVVERLDGETSAQYWLAAASARALAPWPFVWRLSVPPADAPRLLAALEPERYLLDWAGGLIWAAFGTHDPWHVRGALATGHATLWKAPPAERSAAPAFQPPPPGVARVAARIKAALDPKGRLNPGRVPL